MENNRFFPEIHGNFGFGCMRLPLIGEEVDQAEFTKMVDYFLEQGFNYFDTAHGYLGGRSETALRSCLTSRYNRNKFILTNKLSGNFFKTEEDIRPLFQQQLEACGVDYFDFFLMHAQSRNNYEHYKACRAYETAFELKAEGKVRHVGISFHDSPEMLERILTDYPQIEIVQIQFNYLDYENPNVQSRAVYEVLARHNKPVLIMEPVKGGTLAELPAPAQAVFEELQGGTAASYAVRFAAGFPQVCVVLSGMSNMQQMEDNTGFMADFQPLNEAEHQAVKKVREIYMEQNSIPCTACRYCVDGCPKKILIPDLFHAMNMKKVFKDWHQGERYQELTKENGKASDCIRCGQCERACPQHLPIRELLVQVAEVFENEKED
ncbi:MAG: aldo/keto reductase [Oscillospiraceae bacterium]|nr:aldo/keto reductase [Oscillospiraceae bacterium]